jgi:seryl-tRNA synthetase
MTNTNTLSGLIRSYRKQIKQRDLVQKRMQALDAERKQLEKQAREIYNECGKTKQLIDWCIHSGESPVEAQLKHTAEQVAQELEKAPGYDSLKDWWFHNQVKGTPNQTLLSTTFNSDISNVHVQDAGLVGINTVTNPCVIKSHIVTKGASD